MQKNRNSTVRSSYVTSGVASQHTPGGKRPRRWPKMLRAALIVALIAGVAIGAYAGISSLLSSTGKPVRINARPGDNMQPFGNRLLYYDGMSIYCVGASGSTEWSYALGTGGNYYASGQMIVAWVDNTLHVLNKDGQPTYTDRMESTIRFARIGATYVAACMGDDLNSTIRVMSHNGIPVETLKDFQGLYMLDLGFFYTQDQLLWTLGLNISGSSPISKMETFEPGKLITGAVELQDELVYDIYPHNNNLMVVDTAKIRTYNYKCVEQSASINDILVYGWQTKQIRTAGRTTYTLLEKMPTSGNDATFNEVRLITTSGDTSVTRSLRLLTPCFGSGINEKGIYAFGTSTVYYAPYGSNTFKATALTYNVSDFVCMLEGGRAVLTQGDTVFIMQLPK